MPARTTLVLGAGASYSLGFPLGAGLRRQIIRLRNDANLPSLIGCSKSELKEFTSDFETSGQYSIDAFLGMRFADYEKIGKAAIAYVLLLSEFRATLSDVAPGGDHENNQDHWYQYVVNVLTEDKTWDEFDPSWLSIVTFNYDRSFETYLCRALQATYKRSEADVVAKLSSMAIVHVYGFLGSPWVSQTNHVPFGAWPVDHLASLVTIAASQIRVVPEGRDDEPTMRIAQDLLAKAQRICFLGFGFDKVNLRRLGAPASINSFGGKWILGTSIGIVGSPVNRAIRRTNGDAPVNNVVLQQAACLRLLSESLILETA